MLEPRDLTPITMVEAEKVMPHGARSACCGAYAYMQREISAIRCGLCNQELMAGQYEVIG